MANETMSTTAKKEKSTQGKIELFSSFFTGLKIAYGTYDPVTGRVRQIKKPPIYQTYLAHLQGKAPYGVYLLFEDRTRAIVADFDNTGSGPAVEFVKLAGQYSLPVCIEVSKSKGFHDWLFFEESVKAAKARVVFKHILEETGHPNVEIFPKHDYLDSRVSYGNFINAPLFGGLVRQDKTVFIDPDTLRPYSDQWAFLESVERVSEDLLDDIIGFNSLSVPDRVSGQAVQHPANDRRLNRFGLPPCACKMLEHGVEGFQRVSCYRLAVHLKRLGLPQDLTVATLMKWAEKNRPADGKTIITPREVRSQTQFAYKYKYIGYGCKSTGVSSYCDPSCRVYKWLQSKDKSSSKCNADTKSQRGSHGTS